MINDAAKDHVCLSGLLLENHPRFFNQLTTLFSNHQIPFSLIPSTKDIWARDYMPIQISYDEFIQFIYTPDYLKPKTYTHLRTDVSKVCKAIDLNPIKSSIILDGGNVVHYGNKVILCDKILKENPGIPEQELISQLKKIFNVKHVLMIPSHPLDILGHADGVLRFKNSTTVLVSDYSNEDPDYWTKLRKVLNKHRLKVVKVPCNTTNNKSSMDATGIYINFLQVKHFIFLPCFGLPEDSKAQKLFKKEFPKSTIIPVDCRSIATKGGLLNCITWTIRA